MDYLIGIDSGGTKTAFTAYTIDGAALLREKKDGANFSSSFEAALSCVMNGTLSFIRKLDGNCLFIALGASGIRGTGRADEVKKLLENSTGIPCCVIDDGLFGLYSRFGSEDGILVVSGTGSVAYGKKGCTFHSIGGWGHLVDDRGSGTRISLNAIRNLLYRFDEGEKATVLDNRILEHCGVPSPLLVPSFLYTSSKKDIAAIAPIVEDEAKNGDREAEGLLLEAGDELASMVRKLSEILNLDNPSVAISGSILEKCSLVRERMYSSLGEGFIPFASSAAPEHAVLSLYREYKENG